MKKQIFMLIIGVLIGAIITTGVFLVLKGTTQKEGMGRGGFEQNGEMPKMDGNETGEQGGGRTNNKKDNGTNNNSTTNDNTNTSET